MGFKRCVDWSALCRLETAPHSRRRCWLEPRLGRHPFRLEWGAASCSFWDHIKTSHWKSSSVFNQNILGNIPRSVSVFVRCVQLVTGNIRHVPRHRSLTLIAKIAKIAIISITNRVIK
jgi:hypothetical protein